MVRVKEAALIIPSLNAVCSPRDDAPGTCGAASVAKSGDAELLAPTWATEFAARSEAWL